VRVAVMGVGMCVNFTLPVGYQAAAAFIAHFQDTSKAANSNSRPLRTCWLN
jgi:hypothetical protein